MKRHFRKISRPPTRIIPIDAASLLRPVGGVLDQPDPIIGTTAISRTIKEIEEKGKEQGYPVTLGFGWYKERNELLAKRMRESGRDPLDPRVWKKIVGDRSGEVKGERDVRPEIEMK